MNTRRLSTRRRSGIDRLTFSRGVGNRARFPPDKGGQTRVGEDPDGPATRLAESSRHGEWIDIALPGGGKLNSWIVYPERKDKAGVVLVIFDINGMRDLARALGDQLAQDGFIAIVPDFLSGKGPDGGGSASLGANVGQTIRTLTGAEMTERLNAAMEYGKKIPSSNGKTGVTGFCWGGTQTFNYACPAQLNAAVVVYYSNRRGPSSPRSQPKDYAKIKAPVLGIRWFDNRINTNSATEAAMKKLGKFYEPHIFDGAGHGPCSARLARAVRPKRQSRRGH